MVRPVLPCCLKYVLLFALGCILSFSKCCLFSQLDLSLALSCFLNKNSLAPLLFSQQDYCFFLLLLASHEKASWPLTKISSTPSFALSCSLNKNAATLLFLASHQEPLGISPGVSCSLNKIASTSYPRMGAPTCLNQLHEGR